MSNRYGQGRQDHYNNNNKGFNKTQKKFVPKNSTPTLSTSLREKQQSGSGSSGNSSGRVQTGGVNGNFVNYLPQDEAVAAGFGAEDGGLDALESQRVVDLLNSQLSRLLKLKPKEFWSQGIIHPIHVYCNGCNFRMLKVHIFNYLMIHINFWFIDF